MVLPITHSLATTSSVDLLLPGSVKEIREVAAELKIYGRSLENVGQGLQTIDDGGWQGRAAKAFHACFDLQPKRWLEAADCFHDAYNANIRFAETLEIGKRMTREAVDLWTRGVEASKAAGVNTDYLMLQQYHLAAPAQLTDGNDPGIELRAHAESKLERARQQVYEAGEVAAVAIEAATSAAPPNPTFWEQILSFFEGGKEEIEGTAAMANPDNWESMATNTASFVDLASKDQGAAFRQFIDYETMRDEPSKWLGAMAAGILLSKGTSKFTKFAKLPDRLDTHVFHGHKDIDAIKGYHHRYKGADTGDIKLDSFTAPEDPNGVYHAKVTGPDVNGKMVEKWSTFFPDDWSPQRVSNAIEEAFENRERVYGSSGDLVAHKWQARVDGVLIEGMFSRDFAGDFEGATLLDVGTAYPKYWK